METSSRESARERTTNRTQGGQWMRAAPTDEGLELEPVNGPSLDLNAWYQRCAQGETIGVLEELVGWMEQQLYTEAYDNVNAMLVRTIVDKLAPNVVLGALTMSAHAADRLSARVDFVARAERYLRYVLGDDRAERLLVTRR